MTQTVRQPIEHTGPVLVLGGTGKTGRRIVSGLKRRGIETRIGSRSASPAFDWQDPDGWDATLKGAHSVYISYTPDLAVPAAKEAIGHLLDSDKPLAGALRPAELSFLFAESAEQVASTALAPIRYQGLHGVLALGSEDPQQYRSATGTLFLGYVADALARVLLRQRPLADENHA